MFGGETENFWVFPAFCLAFILTSIWQQQRAFEEKACVRRDGGILTLKHVKTVGIYNTMMV